MNWRTQREDKSTKSAKDAAFSSDRHKIKATCLASLKSRSYGRWLQLGVVNGNSRAQTSNVVTDDESLQSTRPTAAPNREVSSQTSVTKSPNRPTAQYHVLVGCEDGSVRVYNVCSENKPPFVSVEEACTLHAHNGPVRQIYVQDTRAPQSLSYSRQSSFTAAGHAEASRVHLATSTGLLVSHLEDDVMFCSAGQDDGTVCIFALNEVQGLLSAECVHSLSGHVSPVVDVQWDERAGFTFCSMACGDTYVWNTTVGSFEQVLPTSQLKHLLVGGNNDQVAGVERLVVVHI